METPYIVTHCKRGHLTQFPQSTIGPPLEYLEAPSKGSLSVAVSCCVCSHVENHTIESRPTRIGTEDTVEYQTQRPAYGFVHELMCDERNCLTPLAVIAPRKSEPTRDQKEKDVFTWEWDELRCPSGHPISQRDA